MTDEHDVAEILLKPCQPSELPRRDAALTAMGVGADALGGLKAAFAAVGLSALDGLGQKDDGATSVRGRLLASVGRPGRYGRYVD